MRHNSDNSNNNNNNVGEGVDIGFKNVSYIVGPKKKSKQILFGVGGRFTSGKLVGILGPSGAGKSTLLNVLSGFENDGVKGWIGVNGRERVLGQFKRMSCYITQDNDLHDLLTVEENMRCATDLKLGNTLDDFGKVELITKILKAFGLYDIRANKTARISGGQKKRLSISLELISNPSVMFLDEPTTGLDSFSSYQCIEHLRDLAHSGKTIICTIHQPSATLFKLFDQVYVLAQGKCLYQGDTNQLVPFLESIGMPCSIYHNPADYVIELASGEYGQDKIDKMEEAVKSGNNIKFLEAQTSMQSARSYKSVCEDTVIKKPPKSNYTELKNLINRECMKSKRNMALTYFRIITNVINSLVVSIIYWKLGGDASKIWFNYNLILSVIMNMVVAAVMMTILVFPKEVNILKKEHFNGYYSLKNYFVSITILDLPTSILCATTANVTIYYLTDQPAEFDRLWRFLLLGFLVTIVAQSLGLFIGSSLNLQNGIFVGSYIHVPLMLVSGFGLTFRDIPNYFYWLSYTSYLRYGVNGMVGTIYGHNRTRLPCPEDAYCHYTYGDRFLKDMGVEGDHFWSDCMMLVGFYIIMRIGAYVAMSRRMVTD